ncbi:MAG: hypothetical protein MJD61_05910 [Proteobacteria bacterium]|nr:hypothetical protein [Pseudomonadota bacterium]
MKNAVDRLQRSVGQLVQSVALQVVFFGLEQQGEAGELLLSFESGLRFTFGCAGDGSVLVTTFDGEIGDAPHTSTTWRPISEATGQLEKVFVKDSSIRLQIDGTLLAITNDDDQMKVTLKGEALPKEVYQRG